MKPAILGGKAFERRLGIIKPNTDRYAEKLGSDIKGILRSNMLTAVDIKLKEFEDALQNYFGVRHAVGLSSCTHGLILSMQALGLRGAEIIMPAFTFSATVHSAYWNGCKIKFADIDETFCLSPQKVEEAITPETKAILAVHMYGNPCDIDALEAIAKKHKLRLIFDCAHALGASYKGRKIGNHGDVEVFSLSPTTLLTTVEGGVAATNNPELAEMLKVDRNYGNNPDYSCVRPGLNARMSEVNAAIGLAQLPDLDTFVANRNRYVQRFKKELAGLSGIKFQKLNPHGISTHKDFGFVVEKEFGLSRDQLARALDAENIMTKFYFYPPMHKLDAYKDIAKWRDLSMTEHVSGNIICLPIYNFMEDSQIDMICDAVKNIYEHREQVRKLDDR